MSSIMKQGLTLAEAALRLTALSELGRGRFSAQSLLQGRMALDAVYGGQMAALLLRAACLTAPEQLLPHATHAFFHRAGSVQSPLQFEATGLHDGRSFGARYVGARQEGEGAEQGQLLASAVSSFHRAEPAAVRHQQPAALGRDPSRQPRWEQALEEALADPQVSNFHRKLLRWKLRNTPVLFRELFEVRPCDPALWTMRRRMPTELPPRHDVFLKCRHSPGPRQQDQRVMLTLMTDLVLMECALLHHINAGFFPTMLFSLDQALYFHADVSTEDWLLCEVRSPVAEAGRAFAQCRFWSPDGRLVASAAQEGIVRFDAQHPGSQAPT